MKSQTFCRELGSEKLCLDGWTLSIPRAAALMAFLNAAHANLSGSGPTNSVDGPSSGTVRVFILIGDSWFVVKS